MRIKLTADNRERKYCPAQSSRTAAHIHTYPQLYSFEKYMCFSLTPPTIVPAQQSAARRER